MYNEVYELISNLLFGSIPDPTSFEALFTTGIAGALSLLPVALPFILGFGLFKMVFNARW